MAAYQRPESVASPLWRKLFPFLRWFPFVGRDTLPADLKAGLTGAVIVLPQSVAFAMIAGMPPQYGLYTAIIPPIVAALFGSSLHLISGPTTAISIVIFNSLRPMAAPGSPAFIQLALTLTFLAGLFQLILGMARLGVLVNFVSHSVVLGFTSGAAILIGTSQLKHLLGIAIPGQSDFLHVWLQVFSHIGETNVYALAIAGFTFFLALGVQRYRPAWPAMLIAMIGGSLLGQLISASAHGVKQVGEIPLGLPAFSLPDLSLQTVHDLAPAALAVALLGLIEALSIARSIAAASQQHIDGNQEFIGQGLSNIVGSFFSCFAASGSFTRSGANYQAGAMTPLSAVFAALLLLLILFALGPWTAYLPIPAMSGVILLVAYRLIDIPHIRQVVRASGGESAVIGVTFLATLLVELEFAVYVGVLLSLILYLSRTAHPRLVELRPPAPSNPGPKPISASACPDRLRILRIDGSLFFGAADYVSQKLLRLDGSPLGEQSRVLIVGSGINFIDVAGATILVQEARRRRKMRGDLYLCELKPQARAILQKGGYWEALGGDHIYSGLAEALHALAPDWSPAAGLIEVEIGKSFENIDKKNH